MTRKKIQPICFVLVLIIQVLCYSKICSAHPACDSRGTLRVVDDRCVCKANVKGSRCDQCKYRHFYLQEYNPEGCVPCACDFPHNAASCATVKRTYSSISLMNNSGKLTDASGTPLDIPITKNSDSSIQFPTRGLKELFWQPEIPSGDYTSAYGGEILLKAGVPIVSSYMSTLLPGAKVMIVSNNGTRIEKSFDSASFGTFNRNRWSILITEGEWQYVAFNEQNMNDPYQGQPVSKRSFLDVLSNVRDIFFRMPDLQSNRYDIKLVSASLPTSSESNQGVESKLEKCICRQRYEGVFCERCKSEWPIFITTNGIPNCVNQEVYDSLMNGNGWRRT